MSNPNYAPHPGSTPHKVLQFLLTNPTAELTRTQIAEQFDVQSGSVDQALSLAKSRGALETSRNSRMQMVWKLGDASVVDLGAPGAWQPAASAPKGVASLADEPSEAQPTMAAALAPAPAAAPEAPAAVDEFAGMPFTVQPKAVEPLDLLTPAEARLHRLRERYKVWFASFRVNDMAVFDAQHIRDVAGRAGKYGIETGTRFRCRKIDADQASITREA